MRFSTSPSFRRLFPFLATLTALIYFFICKIYLFENLAYTSDLFMNNEMTRSWVERGKFLHENHYGGQLPIHNYFLIPFLYPLTAAFRIYGLFVGLWALIAWSLYRFWRVLGETYLSFFFLLPIGFFIFDHPTYGFGIELIQLPLSILLALSLIEKKKVQSFLWGSLVVLNKEDGAVLLCAILVAHHLTEHQWKRYSLLVAKIISCIALFILGLAFQRLQGERTLNIVGMFLDTLSNQGDVRNWIRGIKVSLLLVLPLFVVLAPRQWKSWLPSFMIGFIPLAIVALVGAASYGSEDWMHGIHWSIRYVLIWGFALSLLIFIISTSKPKNLIPNKMALFMIVSLIQVGILAQYRKYYLWERALPFFFQNKLPINDLSQEEQNFFRCLSRELPKRFPIAVDWKLFTYFHEQDIVSPDATHNAWKEPEIFICSTDITHFSGKKCFSHQSKFEHKLKTHTHKRWIILSTEEALQTVNACEIFSKF